MLAVVRWVSTLARISVAVAASSMPVWGEIIVDEFDDDFSVVASSSRLGPDDNELGVGELASRRILWAAELRSGEFDSAVSIVSSESVAVVSLPTLPQDPSPGHSQFELSYFEFGGRVPDFFDPTAGISDLTEDGVNDALIIDFDHIRGTNAPAMRLNIINANGWHFVLNTELELSEEPFTLMTPFSDFRDRGDSDPISADSASRVTVEFFSAGLWEPRIPNEQWTVGLDRIRIGAVPEPSGAFLIFFAFALNLTRSRHKMADQPS